MRHRLARRLGLLCEGASPSNVPAMKTPRPLLALAALLVCLAAPAPAEAAPAAPPNLLMILADNLGKDWLGCYGSDEGVTPNLDRLAAEGLRFDNFYVTALCSTSRAALMTGRYGWRTGWHTHHDSAIYGGGFLDPEREVVLARPLREAGYATAVTGKWQINDGRFFDLESDPEERHDLAGTPDADLAPDAAAARLRLRAVHAELPPDADPGFEPRSQSAFRMRGEDAAPPARPRGKAP